MRLEQHHRAVTDELERYGIRPIIEPTRGGHIRFRWSARGKELQIVTATSTSDHRAAKNNVATVRRMMREVGASERTIPTMTPQSASPGPKPPTMDERLTRLEADMRLLLDLMTDPERAAAAVAPVLASIVPARRDEKRGFKAPPAKDIREHLLETVREFERVTGMVRSAIGKEALGDTSFLFRIEKGEDFTMRNYRRITDFMRARWPVDTVPLADPKEKPTLTVNGKMPKPKPERKPRDCGWLWRALRYDIFLTVTEVAKAAGKPYHTTAALLSFWKKRGYVEHVDHGWRKHRKVEELDRAGATHH